MFGKPRDSQDRGEVAAEAINSSLRIIRGANQLADQIQFQISDGHVIDRDELSRNIEVLEMVGDIALKASNFYLELSLVEPKVAAARIAVAAFTLREFLDQEKHDRIRTDRPDFLVDQKLFMEALQRFRDAVQAPIAQLEIERLRGRMP
jgi:hypothetical protein